MVLGAFRRFAVPRRGGAVPERDRRAVVDGRSLAVSARTRRSLAVRGGSRDAVVDGRSLAVIDRGR